MITTPQEILASIPGWEDASCEPLTGGTTNAAWKVSNGAATAVLKYDSDARELPFVSRLAEARIQHLAADKGLAPPVLYATDRVLLTRFAEGAVWRRESFRDAGKLQQAAAALRRLHALPLSGRPFAADAAARQYTQRLHAADQTLVRRCLDVVARRPSPERPCCCHNDLVAENLISTPSLEFLDWEFAADNDPLFDLATIAEHHQLDDGLVQVLLAAYFDGDGQRRRGQLDEQRQLYLALWYLWLAAREARDPQEFEDVGVRFATSCS